MLKIWNSRYSSVTLVAWLRCARGKSLGSIVGMDTAIGLSLSSRQPPVNQWPGLFPPWWNCRKVKLTTYVHLVPKRRLLGAIASYAFVMWCLVHTWTICLTTFERGYCYWLESHGRRPVRNGSCGKVHCTAPYWIIMRRSWCVLSVVIYRQGLKFRSRTMWLQEYLNPS